MTAGSLSSRERWVPQVASPSPLGEGCVTLHSDVGGGF